MKPKEGGATAIIYARVSSVRQAEDGLPIASQLEQARRKAEQLQARVLREFRDEGLSGRTTRRPEFQRALAFCKAHDVDFFIVWNSARFARNKIDAAQLKKLLRSGGTRVAYVSTEIDPSTDEGWLSESIIEIMDEMFSRSVAKDTRRSMMKNAADGYFNGGRVPYGYTVVPAGPDGKRRRLAIDELEAGLVRRIFRDYANQGMGFKTIAVLLNREGFRKRGEPWSKKGVGLVLQNYRYAGISIFNRRDHQERAWRDPSQWITTESHEAIIDRETFERAQVLMKAKAPVKDAGSPKSRFAFTGIACCGACGRTLKIETATGRSKRYSYYRCSSAIEGTGCTTPRIPAHKLDEWLMGMILERIITAEVVNDYLDELRDRSGTWTQDRKEARALLVKELRDVETKRDRLFEVLEASGSRASNLKSVTERLEQHRRRIAQIQTSLQGLEDAPDADLQDYSDLDVQDVIAAIAATIRECESPETLRLFFGGLLEKIVVHVEGKMARAVFTYYPERMLAMNATETVHGEGRWLPDQALLRTAQLEAPLPPALRRAA